MENNQNLQQPLKISAELTQYKIQKVLGSGGFGITYLAMDLNLDRQVVIKEFFPKDQVMRSSGSEVKVLSSGSSNNSLYQNSLKKFLAEGRTLAKFRHNNIALVLTAFPENNTAYLVMQYKPGEDLATFIKKRNRPLDFTQIKKLFLPICKGLQALHKQDLLHLDIKPDNIYLPDSGEPYLIDFGGIRQFIASNDVSASFMVLTPGYAPAEQHSNTSKLGFYSDIYALGMTIYYTLTLEKELPQSTSRQQSLFEGDDDPLPLLSASVITKNYPPYFIALIEQAIQPNRKHRLQKIDDLISVLEGKKIKYKKPTTSKTNQQQTSKQNSPSSTKKVISTLLIMVLVASGLWQLNAYQQKQEKIKQQQEKIKQQQEKIKQQQEKRKQADATLYQYAKTTSTISNYEYYLEHCEACEDKKQAQIQIKIIKQQKAEQQKQAEIKAKREKAEQQRQAKAKRQAEADRQAEAKIAKKKRQAALEAEQQRQAEATRQAIRSMKFILIPAGSFRMGDGSSDEEPVHTVNMGGLQGVGNSDEKPVHTVNIKAFYISATEITQDQWKQVMGDNPSGFKSGDHYPVENVSWNKVKAFIQELNGQTGKTYRLPSEAEWEYAARAGSTTQYSWGNDAPSCSQSRNNGASFDGGEGSNCYYKLSNGDYRGTQPVASYHANAWGLYDMHGNVWEWTQDCWHSNYNNAPTDGSAWESGGSGNCAIRVLRGGSWFINPMRLRSASRGRRDASNGSGNVGFRLIQNP